MSTQSSPHVNESTEVVRNDRYNAAPGDTPIGKLPYLPSNHQSNFLPDPEPTLRVGVRALTSAALAYLPPAANEAIS
jgi:hippurate hydrolase